MNIFSKLFGKNKVNVTAAKEPSSEDPRKAIADVSSILSEQKKRYDEIANGKKRMQPVPDGELMQYFAEYFAPNKEFFSSPGSQKYQAYFDAVNAARLEMLNQPTLYNEATGRTVQELSEMVNNPKPGITNMLVCGMIYCMGKYAVIKDFVYCVDFLPQLPNCIALYLLLIAQKSPSDQRKQILDTGDGVDPAPLKTVIESLKILDPSWDPIIF